MAYLRRYKHCEFIFYERPYKIKYSEQTDTYALYSMHKDKYRYVGHIQKPLIMYQYSQEQRQI